MFANSQDYAKSKKKIQTEKNKKYKDTKKFPFWKKKQYP